MNAYDLLSDEPSFSVVPADLSDSAQISAIQELVLYCQSHDRISLSCPLDPEDEAQHFLLYETLNGNQQLLSVLSVLQYDDSTAECIAFTHPQHRQRGYFSRLLFHAMNTCEFLEECDILFPVSGTCPDTLATLDALGASLENEELQMQLDFCEIGPEPVHGSSGFSLLSQNFSDANGVIWKLLLEKDGQSSILGCCQTSIVSEHCVCLHHVEIFPEFRRRGYGTILLQKLLQELKASGFSRMILQVAGDNAAAISLYKKQGFRITETLSFYLY